jgi:hypothetical protein
MAADARTAIIRADGSYQPDSVQTHDDGTWTVRFTAGEEFGEELALLRAAAWLAHHREHTLRDLACGWQGDETDDDLEPGVQLVVIADVNTPHFPALHRFALPASSLVNTVMAEALTEHSTGRRS